MKKRNKRHSHREADVITKAGEKVISAAEKGLSKTVTAGLDVLEGVLKALNPFTK